MSLRRFQTIRHRHQPRFLPATVVFGHLFLYFPVADLIGYGGGELSTQSRIDMILSSAYLFSGSVTLAPATVVPEAST
jgi:hypothetical protein